MWFAQSTWYSSTRNYRSFASQKLKPRPYIWNCAHPDGVDVDDVDDVDERRHFGVVLLVGGCLDGVLVDEGVVVEAKDELLSDGLAVEGEPRYLCDESYAIT